MKSTKNTFVRGIERWFVLAIAAGLIAAGCGPDGNETTTGSSSTGGSSSSGGPTTECIDATTYADVLTISDGGFCVVASYEAEAIKGSLTWGSHGGPMFVVQSAAKPGSVDITRLTPPDMATTGKLASGTNSVDLGLPMGAFLGSQVLDLPFFNWSLVSYTNPDLTGKIILFEGNNLLLNYPINGFFSATTVGAGEPLGRIVYSGLSPIFKNATNTNALYAADACGAVGNNPRLVSDGDATCSDSFAIEAFGMYSGPVAADAVGNVFAVMSLAGGDQEARGYAADSVKRGSGPATGTSMFTVPGFAGSLAAVAPDGTGTGVVVFQPQEFDMASGMSLGKDVVAQRFKVEGGAIVNIGVAGPFMTPAASGEVLNFVGDDQGRIWVAVKRGAGYAMLVLARIS